MSYWNPGSLAPDPSGSYASTFTIQGSPWIIEEPHGAQALGSLILSRVACVCSLYIYSIGFISLPSMWLHGGGKGGGEGHHPPQPDSLTLHAQPGPCPAPSLPASVSGPQVHFRRKKSTWPCRSGDPVDPDTQGQRTKPGEGSRGRSQG